MPESPPLPDGVPPEIQLDELGVRAVLSVRALEEADPAGSLVPREEHRRATEQARAADERFGPYLATRARALLPAVDRVVPGLARLRRVAGLDLAATWIVVPALVLGVATNLVGAEQRINVLANPLAALILWNLAVYGLVLGAMLRAAPRGKGTTPAPPSRLGGLAAQLSAWRARRGNAARGELAARVSAAYLAGWTRCARPLLGTRLARALHLGAAAMAVGALAGMYVRGLLLEYQVTWESTFLGPRQVEAWLVALLGPASLLPGLELPGPGAIEAIRAPASGAAALWIHLYAGSTLLLVVLPRVALAFQATWAARRRAGALQLDTRARYYHRLFAGARGAGLRARVQPYSYTPAAAHVDRLKTLLHDVLGAQAAIDVGPGLAYGDTAGEAGAAGDTTRVVLFNLAQTPESEVHGRLLEALVREPAPLLVLVDAAGWRERPGGPAIEERLAERRRTWDRVVRATGAEAIHVDLERGAPDELVQRCEAALQHASQEEPTP